MRNKKYFGLIALAVLTAIGTIFLGSCGPSAEVKLKGAGATFPKPVYDEWMQVYQEETNVPITYEGIGSGGGQKAIIDKTVDFAGSDAVMKTEDLEKQGLLQFPMIVGGIVPVINIPGVEANELKLDAELLGRIFAGDITTWNHEDIAVLNTGLELPEEAITVVHRSDGSGTTWTFTLYLHQASDYWKNNMSSEKKGEVLGISYGKSIKWPTGNFIGGKGNPGVANYVKESKNSIGYVEYAYALTEKLTTIQLLNKAGKHVEPSLDTFAEAAAKTDWTMSGIDLIPVNKPGDDSWPIVGVSFILIYKEQDDEAKAKAMLKYLDWCFDKGADAARELHYVPIPRKVADEVRELWEKEVKYNDTPIEW